MAYSALHYNLLLAHMLKTPAVRELAIKNLQPSFFTNEVIGGTYAQAVLFEIISEHFRKFSVAPDPAVLMIESRRIFTNFLAGDQVSGALRDVIEFIKLVNIADDRSVALSRELVLHMHDTCVHKVAVAEAADALVAGSPASEIGARLLDLERKAKSLLGTNSQSKVSERALSGGARVLTGLPFVDSRMGAGYGLVQGCALGIIAPQASGKCLAIGTKVRKFDGSVVSVENLVVGDLLMGPDSRPRTVQSTCRGTDEMFEIKPFWFDSFVCNSVHVLTLQNIDTHEVIDIPLDEYVKKCTWFKERHKLFRAAVEYPERELPVDPYLVGAWLGDGNKDQGTPAITKNDQVFLDYVAELSLPHGVVPRVRVDKRNNVKTVLLFRPRGSGSNPLRDQFRKCITSAGEKFIPENYLHASRNQRLRLLAGLIDTDGHCAASKRGSIEFVTKFIALRDSVRELLLSLGYMCSVHPKVVNGSTYWRFHIANVNSEVPCVIPRKMATGVTSKRHRGNRSKFEVVSKGVGEYAGFTLDGDGRFLLEDFTVTHNTTFGIQLSISQALMGRPTLLVLAEEGLSLPLRRNLLACASSIPTTILERHESADGVPNMVEAAKHAGLDVDTVMAKIAQLDKNLNVLDLNEVPGTLPEIETEIQNMADDGRLPSYVYIDWAGILADRMMATGADGVKYDKKYEALKAIAYHAARMAAKFENQIAVAQQMAPEIIKKGPMHIADSFCSADCKGFTETFKYVFVINAREPKTGLSLCRVTKARNDPPGIHYPLLLNGAIAQFQDMSHKFAAQGKRFKAIQAVNNPAVPKEGG